MTERTTMDPFENRLAALIHAHTEPAERPVDALAVARAAMAGSGARRSSTGGIRTVGMERRRAWLLALVAIGLLAALAVASIGGRPTSREPLLEKLVYVDPDVGLVLEDPPGSTPKVLVAASKPGGEMPPCFRTDQLGHGPACWSGVAFAPSGKYIAISAHDTYEISILTLDGHEVGYVRVNAQGWQVSWSPVDDVIPVISRVLPDGTTEIGIVDPSGQVTRRVTIPWGVKGVQDWSPDGSHLVVQSHDPPELWTVDIATGAWARLTDTPTVHEQQSAWSPDGSLIAYTSDCGDAWTPDGPCPWSIWTVRPDGSDRRRLTPEDGYVSAWPVWAPDGKHLAYTRDTTAPTDATVNGSVYVVDADGSDPHRITTFETGWAAVQGRSPDGSTIVVVHGVTDLATDEVEVVETWIMGADGSNPRLLVPGTSDVDWVWSSAD